ncbi:MAG: hypothetical protein ACO3CQ_04780 [Candidatus Nanopelagicaceae bacterium]
MKKYYDRASVVFIHSERAYGVTESLGIYASKIKYQKDGKEYEAVFDNEDFTILDEIIFEHVEEEN